MLFRSNGTVWGTGTGTAKKVAEQEAAAAAYRALLASVPTARVPEAP